MAESNQTHANGTLAAFAAGSLIGLFIGFLYAPKRGQESRQMINDKIRTNKDMFKQKMSRAKEAMRAKANEEDMGQNNSTRASKDQ